MEDTHSTTIAAFMVEKFVVIVTDSRRCSFTNYGTVYGNDDFIKIHHICSKVYGAGSGSFNMVNQVFNEARELWRNNIPDGVEQVAGSVAVIANDNMNQVCSTSFVVGGQITGTREMYSIKYYTKLEEGEVKLKESTAEKKSLKRKDRDAKEEYEYRVKPENEIFLGSGRKEMLDYLENDTSEKNYPFTDFTTLEEAKNFIKELMRDPLNYDFCTDGMLRLVSISEEEGIVGRSSAEIVDLGHGQDRFYGDWIEDSFYPVGQNN